MFPKSLDLLSFPLRFNIACVWFFFFGFFFSQISWQLKCINLFYLFTYFFICLIKRNKKANLSLMKSRRRHKRIAFSREMSNIVSTDAPLPPRAPTLCHNNYNHSVDDNNNNNNNNNNNDDDDDDDDANVN